MRSWLFEWGAAIFGTTVQERWWPFFLALGGALLLALFFTIEWGFFRGFLPVFCAFALALWAARSVVVTREALWRAAQLALSDPAQNPRLGLGNRLVGNSADALEKLAIAVDQVRRGDVEGAKLLVDSVDRALLRPDEMRLRDAVLAMVALGKNDRKRAAELSVLALPTQCACFDRDLGRVLLASAFHESERLSRILDNWEASGGLCEDGLGRLSTLGQIALAGGLENFGEHLSSEEAKLLSVEAKAVGDMELCAELEARARIQAYR